MTWVGTNENGNHFNGLIDEVRLYEKDLSSNEMASIFLNGTMRFQTSAVSLPPVVEVSSITPPEAELRRLPAILSPLIRRNPS